MAAERAEWLAARGGPVELRDPVPEPEPKPRLAPRAKQSGPAMTNDQTREWATWVHAEIRRALEQQRREMGNVIGEVIAQERARHRKSYDELVTRVVAVEDRMKDRRELFQELAGHVQTLQPRVEPHDCDGTVLDLRAECEQRRGNG